MGIGDYYIRVPVEYGKNEYIKLYKSDTIRKIGDDWYSLYGYITKRGFFSSDGSLALRINNSNGQITVLEKYEDCTFKRTLTGYIPVRTNDQKELERRHLELERKRKRNYDNIRFYLKYKKYMSKEKLTELSRDIDLNIQTIEEICDEINDCKKDLELIKLKHEINTQTMGEICDQINQTDQKSNQKTNQARTKPRRKIKKKRKRKPVQL